MVASKILATGILVSIGFLAQNASFAQSTVDESGQAVKADQTQIDKDQATLNQLRQQEDAYVRKVRAQLNQAEAARPGIEQRIQDLKKSLSESQIRKMVSTPGNELYVLNNWLKQERESKGIADRYIGYSRYRIQQAQAALAQDQINMQSDQGDQQRAQAAQDAQDSQPSRQDQETSDANYWSRKEFGSTPENTAGYVDPGSVNPIFSYALTNEASAPSGSMDNGTMRSIIYMRPYNPENQAGVLKPLYTPGASQDSGTKSADSTGR